LAWEIQKYYKDANIRLEYCPDPKINAHIDIIIEINNKLYPIELKYKTKTFNGKDNNEEYNLKIKVLKILENMTFLRIFKELNNFLKILKIMKMVLQFY